MFSFHPWQLVRVDFVNMGQRQRPRGLNWTAAMNQIHEVCASAESRGAGARSAHRRAARDLHRALGGQSADVFNWGSAGYPSRSQDLGS